MPKYTPLGILIYLAIFLFPLQLHAYDDTYYKENVEVFDNHVLPRIRSKLTPSERTIIDQVDIEIINNTRIPNLAVTTDAPPKIYISLGFLDGLFQHIDCVLLETSPAGFPEEMCARYFSYYLRTAIDLSKPHPLPVAAIALPTEQHVDDWYAHPTWQNARNLMFQSAIIAIIMHEYGHHFEGFYNEGSTLSDKREVERRADQWSFERLDAIGEPPLLGAVVALGYIARMEKYRSAIADAARNDPSFVQADRLHPRPKDRVSWAYDRMCNTSAATGNAALEMACSSIKRQIDQF